ncbi:hypothetical protein AVEN_166152-1, partial [Araneus ventricosus]
MNMDLVHVKPTWIKRSSAGVVWKFGEGDTSSGVDLVISPRFKLRGPSQNNPRVASKAQCTLADS